MAVEVVRTAVFVLLVLVGYRLTARHRLTVTVVFALAACFYLFVSRTPLFMAFLSGQLAQSLDGNGILHVLYGVFAMHTINYVEATFYNMLIFVPVGYLLPAWSVGHRRWGRVVVVAALLSLCVEVAQELTGFGMLDVVDMVANTVGAAVGAWLFLRLPAY